MFKFMLFEEFRAMVGLVPLAEIIRRWRGWADILLDPSFDGLSDYAYSYRENRWLQR